MARYIDAEKIPYYIAAADDTGSSGRKVAFKCDIDKIPTADVRLERHGCWVSWEEAGNFILSPDRYECSVCHDAAQRLCNGFDLLSSYCPNCGAKMDGKDGESDERA